jgi:exodeoxyribonuclease-3
MRIATWNVNSIRARHERLLAWLDRQRPDALCLQETKIEDGTFPEEAYREVGYRAAFHGQKTYNGVAILSLDRPVDVQCGLDDGVDDPQARCLAATVGGVRLISVYVPNGQAVGTPAFEYKLRWLERLHGLLVRSRASEGAVAVCGDFNVAPDDRDVHDPAAWRDQLLCHPDERAAVARLVDLGFRDGYRLHHHEGGAFTWWDYRGLSFPKNLGLRIDHVLLSPSLARTCRSVEIDRNERKGPRPSDHAPVVVEVEP